MGERVVLIDGSALIFRAYYAIPSSFRTSQGLPTNAIYGFATMFRKLLGGKRPRYGAVVFDPPGPTVRAEKYPEYKAERPRMGEDLFVQLEWIDELVRKHGFPVLRVPRYEADDVIGTLAKQAVEAGHEVVIVSGDKDFAQLITDQVKMFDPFKEGSGVTYDPELVRKKWGVRPEQFVDYLALVGDKVDNVPGVPGIGKKGASQLLEQYGSLSEILAHSDELKGRKKTTLSENRELALLSQDLVTIVTDVPLAEALPPERGLEALALPAEPDAAALDAFYGELQFYSLLTEGARDADADVGERDYRQVAGPEPLLEWIAQAEGAVVWEPCFEGLGDEPGRLVGLAVCPQVGESRYLPLSGPHAPPGLREEGLAACERWAPLRVYLADAARPKAAHDAKALWVGLARLGVELAGVEFDTRLASFLLDPTKLIPHRLNQVTKEYLQRTVRELKGVVGSGKKQVAWSEAPFEVARDHACHRADAVAELVPILVAKLEESEQLAFHREHDLALSWVLGRMELAGILVDPDELGRLGAAFHEELAGYEAKIHELAGKAFNVNSTKQLGAVLFDELGLPVIKRTKTGYSTNQEVLERLKSEHPIAEQILHYRALAKLINTYTDVLQRAADPSTHRIHATFQQTTGATGRLISTDPDLQRTPVRGERGVRIRRCFVAPPEHQIVSADWSQIELRLMADASGDENLVAAFVEGRDVHAFTAGQLFDVPAEQVTSAQRRIGKTVNFATIYGQGATALGQILEIPRKEAKRYIEGFFATYEGVRRWLDETTERALEEGYVTPRLGRRRYIPELSSNNKMMRQAGIRIAANTPLQGSGADICKLAMLELDRRLRAEQLAARMVLQIHDELLFETPLGEVERVSALAKEVMEGVVELKVPLVVDVGVGASWGDAK